MSRESLIGLSLIARPGIAVRLLDSGLREIARGIERIDTEQPRGLYMVEWSSAGQQSQTLFRLDASEGSQEIRFDPSDNSRPEVLEHSSTKRLALVDAVSSALKPPGHHHESSIVLLVSGDARTLKKTGDLGLSLYDRDEITMHANQADTPNLVLTQGERAYCYRVKPGRYHIGFQSILGERLGQSIPAMAGRQTLVFLSVSNVQLVVADNNKFAKEMSVGVDAARTTIITVRGDEEDYRVRERHRLAGLLLFDLANATNSLSHDVVSVLEQPETDPLLKLYGVLVALSAKERGQPMGLNDTGNHRDWLVRMRNWIGDPGQKGLPTDALAACWELQRLDKQAFGKSAWETLPSRIDVPPMLECAWRWAIEESVTRPNAVRGTAAVAATARSAGGSQPWLCWQLAAATARSAPGSGAVGDLPKLVAQVARKVATFANSEGFHRSTVKSLEAFSPDIQATAIRTLQLVRPHKTRASLKEITDLALSLGLPSRLLNRRLLKTIRALDGTEIEVPSIDLYKTPGRVNTPYLEQPPGLSRRILHRDDLQKGRFGGKARRGNFVVSAKFEKTSSKNWIRVNLVVAGPGRDGQQVQFHLHDSFNPPLKTRRFRSGVVKLSVVVWGGFTLGVWIPAHDVELELDLAHVEGAPRIIRER